MCEAKQDAQNADRRPGAANDVSRYDLRVLNAIRQIIRAADLDSRKLAAEHHITSPQLMCLLTVIEKDSATAIDIASRIHISPSTLVGVLDRLEDKGFIARERSQEDRREVLVTATDAGREFTAHTPFPLQYSLQRALRQLSEKERRELADWMERLVDLMGAREVEVGPMLEIGAIRKTQDAVQRRA